jgi:DNA primase large subunit
MVSFDKVETALETAKGIAFDTCHKIYVLMDEDQVELMREYEYDEIRSIADISKESMLELLKDWYASSCSLRFIQSVRTTSPDDEDSGYDDLISQFEEIDEDGMY